MTINPGKVRRFAAIFGGGGPDLSLAEARGISNDLRVQAARASEIVAKVTGLDEAAGAIEDVQVAVVDRATWAGGTSVAINRMLDSSVLKTRHAAPLFTAFSRAVLGQFDPFTKRVMLVAPNVANFRQRFNLDQRDVALWVAVHEVTHAIQFAAAPWLAGYLREQINIFVDGLTGSKNSDGKTLSAEAAGKPSGPDSADKLYGAESADKPSVSKSAERLEEQLEKVNAVMSFLEGHAEYVMNHVPYSAMPGRQRIVQSLHIQRSSRNIFKKHAVRAAGLDKKVRQYTDGFAFVEAVVKEVGMEGLNRVWESVDTVPMPEEIATPALWLKRMESTEGAETSETQTGEVLSD